MEGEELSSQPPSPSPPSPALLSHRPSLLVAEPCDPKPEALPILSIPLPLPPFPTVGINPVFFPPLSSFSSCSLSPCSSSPPSPSSSSLHIMQRAHHEKSTMEPRITRSRAKSIERAKEKEKQRPSTRSLSPPSPPSPPPEKPVNLFQTEKTPQILDSLSSTKSPVSPTRSTSTKAATASPSLADEIAQARKEEGLTEFTGETQQTPAPLQAAVRQPGKRITVKAIPSAQAEAAKRAEEEKEEEEERKEARPEPAIPSSEKEDSRDLFSTALPSPPPSPTRSPAVSSAFPPIFDKHESLSTFSLPPSSSSSLSDKELAWQLQQEEYDVATSSRSLSTFLSELSYQPRWLRIALSTLLVVCGLLPIFLLPRLEAVVTLLCTSLTLISAYYLYRTYHFTRPLFYSCALLLPSLLVLLDEHVSRTSVDDVQTLASVLWQHPRLWLDGVVMAYLWAWAAVCVQAVCGLGGMWLALRG